MLRNTCAHFGAEPPIAQMFHGAVPDVIFCHAYMDTIISSLRAVVAVADPGGGGGGGGGGGPGCLDPPPLEPKYEIISI